LKSHIDEYGIRRNSENGEPYSLTMAKSDPKSCCYKIKCKRLHENCNFVSKTTNHYVDKKQGPDGIIFVVSCSQGS